MRYFINLAFKGTDFHGWQMQPNALSVQEKINEGLSILLKKDICVLGAGRTDAGVHAKQMYAHFDIDQAFDCEKMTHRLNAFLPDAIFIKSIFPVSDSLHARFNAKSRVYEYWLCQSKNPFLMDGAWIMYSSLNFDLMNDLKFPKDHKINLIQDQKWYLQPISFPAKLLKAIKIQKNNDICNC